MKKLTEVFSLEEGDVVQGPWKGKPSAKPAPSSFRDTRNDMELAMRDLPLLKKRFPAWVKELGGDIDSEASEIEQTFPEKGQEFDKRFQDVLEKLHSFLGSVEELLALGEE